MGRDTLERLWTSIIGLGARRLIALALIGISVMAVLGVGTYYLGRPQQDVLYTGLTRDDVGRIGTALKDAGIDFDVNADGQTVTVNYGDTARARMLLAEKGLPESANAGYDLFDKVGSFGLTSFMQNVTMTRALEGELERTIQTMDGILSARVHLVLADSSSLRSQQQQASASVVIRTAMPTDASPAQAIRHLVAAAVPGLKVNNVTVLNTEGTLLASGDDIESASAGKMATVEQTVNREIEDKVRRTLTPYLGLGNFQVSVATRLNLDQTTTNEVIYDPSSRVERSVRMVTDNSLAQNSSSDAAASVQQNLPTQTTNNNANSGSAGKNSNETNNRREETTNYEVSQRTVQTTHDGFTMERMSIAVLVNKGRLDAVAKQGPDAVPVETQLMNIEQLVSAAAGFSKTRGDQLKVASVDFVNDLGTPAPAPGVVSMLTAQAGSLFKSFALVIVAVVVVLLGFRPAVRLIMSQPAGLSLPAELTAVEAVTATQPPGLSAAIAAPIGEENVNLIEDVTKRMNRSPQKRLEQIVEYDEAQAAAILRQWLHQDEAA
jgi:flagellar M-ring protein FliF